MERKVNFRDLELELTISQEHDWLIDKKRLLLCYGISVEDIKRIQHSNGNFLVNDEHYIRIKEITEGTDKYKVFWTKKGVLSIGFHLESNRAKEFMSWAKNLKIDEDDISEENNLLEIQDDNQDDDTSIKNQLATIMVVNEENQVKDGFQDEQTMSSREIAELTGKRHDHVLRDCDVLNENYKKIPLPKLGEGYYTHPNTGNQQHREFHLTKIQCLDLATGYSIELRIKVNRRWLELEMRQKPSEDEMIFASFKVLMKRDEENKQKLLEANNRIQAQKETIEELTPAAEKYKKWLDSDGLIDMAITAQILNITYYDEDSQKKKLLGRNTLFKFLKEFGILKNNNTPYQSYVKYFEVKQTLCPDAVYRTKIFVKPEGVDFIEKILKKHLTSIAK